MLIYENVCIDTDRQTDRQTDWPYYMHVVFVINSHIDQGKNPQLYTQQCLQKVHEKSMQVQQKVDAYKVLSIKCLIVVYIY